MEGCIFCKIVKGELPSYKVYEDDLFYAFLDIYPHVVGHIQVIPKKHYQWTYDVPEFGKYWEAVHTITRGVQEVLQPTWVNYFTFGLIPHAHIHILPRTGKLPAKGVDVLPPSITVTEDELKTLAESLSHAIKNR